MTNAFEIALSNSLLRDFKEKELVKDLNVADDLCTYINRFLPAQLKNLGEDAQSSENEDEDEECSKKKQQPLKFGKASRAKTIEELHERIEKLRGKKVNYKEKLLKKGLKNRLKKKQKLEERKQMKNAARKQGSSQEEPGEATKTPVSENQNPNVDVKPCLQFNKIVISDAEVGNKQRLTDPKRLLQQLEKKNEKLQKLEEKGKKDKLREIKAKESWEVAIKKAEGVKIKDDVELLKKSISKIKQRKIKSKKKWEEREKSVTTKKEVAQKKRKENIDKKRKERAKKRTKVLIKKARILPK